MQVEEGSVKFLREVGCNGQSQDPCPPISAHIALPSMRSNVVPGEGTKLGLNLAPSDMLRDGELTELTELQFLHLYNGHSNNTCLEGLSDS